MAPDRPRRRIPDATVSRLPVYLGILGDQAQAGVANISSDGLAELAGVNAAKVRKDLSYLGSYGTRGVGYEVGYLVYQIRRELGLTHDWPVVIVGAGNLGQALAGYGGFGERGFPVVGIVDVDKSKVGSVLGGLRVRHIDELPQLWHVVGGSMSLVGPRPMIPGICERMDDDFRAIRQLAKPGVTGLWQISEDGTRLVLEATHYDERYVEWASPGLDLWIIAKTVLQVLGARQLTEIEVLDRLGRRIPFGPLRRKMSFEFSDLIDATPIATLRPEQHR